MLVDANLLLYSVDETSPFHERAATWFTRTLNGPRRVGLPWQVLTAFVRIVTHPRAVARPRSPDEAWERVDDWLALDITWTPIATERHAEVLGSLIRQHQIRGNLVYDAHIAALAIEHGLTLCSTDTDFGRFEDLRWENPLVARR
ncbi:MAG: TA system VapC family ribonuclease toxin [Actinomycetota bacterium]